MPAHSSPKRSADNEVCCDGLSTTVLPATSGAPSFDAANMSG